MNLHRKLVVQRPPTIREEVFKLIREMILKGETPPGTKLVEAQLAEQFGTSRTPVREALHTLEKENLVESIPRVGYVVREITEEEVEEIIEIRIALETLAAKRAAAKISPEELRELHRIIGETEACIRKKETETVVALNTRFHEGICKASRSRRILDINLGLRDHMLMFRNRAHSIARVAREANEGHKRILAAIEQSDLPGIEVAVHSHLAWTREDMVRSIRH